MELINYCIDNNLIITNTFYQYKKIHTFVRVVENKTEKSGKNIGNVSKILE